MFLLGEIYNLLSGERVMKMTRIRIPVAVLAAMVFLIFSSLALAAHPGGSVTLMKGLDSNGIGIPAGTTDAYSPKATCTRACHTASGDPVEFAGHDYGSGDQFSTHVQGVLDSTDTIYWQAYKIKSYAHGVSASKHTNEGRNENYSNATRKALGDPFFTSSPGMWGKY
jgi:hypothetical protein